MRSMIFLIMFAVSACMPLSQEDGGDVPLDISIIYLNTTTTTDFTNITMQGSIGTFAGGALYNFVNWVNELTGQEGSAVVWTEINCGFICINHNYFQAEIPLEIGVNNITVTRTNANGRSGVDSIAITRTADTTPPTVSDVKYISDTMASIVFSEEMDVSTLNGISIKIYDYDGIDVTAYIEPRMWNRSVETGYYVFYGLSCEDAVVVAMGGYAMGVICDRRTEVVVTLTKPLNFSMRKTAYISGSVQDISGNAMINDVSIPY